MTEDQAQALIVRRWRYLWWEYSVVNGGMGLYVEVRGSVYGTSVSLRHSWAKWKMIVGLYAAGFAMMTIITLVGAVTALGQTGGSGASVFVVILFSVYAAVAYMSLMIIHNTLAASRAFKKRRNGRYP